MNLGHAVPKNREVLFKVFDGSALRVRLIRVNQPFLSSFKTFNELPQFFFGCPSVSVGGNLLLLAGGVKANVPLGTYPDFLSCSRCSLRNLPPVFIQEINSFQLD